MSFAPDIIVIVSQTATELMTGKLVTLIDGMIIFVVAVGTIPPHQLAPSSHAVLLPPIQVPGIQLVVLTLSIPEAVVPKKVEFLTFADETVLP